MSDSIAGSVNSRLAHLAVAVLALAAVPSAVAQPPQGPPKPEPRAIPYEQAMKPWTGDFDGMLEQRRVRVLAAPSRTFFFNELGRERGYSADIVRAIEKQLNTTLASQIGKRPLTFVIIPTTRDKLVTGVVEGLGDIAVNLGVTDTRKQTVDSLIAPDTPPVSEVVLSAGAPRRSRPRCSTIWISRESRRRRARRRSGPSTSSTSEDGDRGPGTS